MKPVKKYTFYPEWGNGVIDEEVGGDYVQSDSYDALLAERDELLAALELCLNAVGLAGWSDDHCAVTARAVIAKARGDA